MKIAEVDLNIFKIKENRINANIEIECPYCGDKIETQGELSKTASYPLKCLECKKVYVVNYSVL